MEGEPHLEDQVGGPYECMCGRGYNRCPGPDGRLLCDPQKPLITNPWKSMSSAPKDGTLIDLMYPYPRGRTVDCSWRHGGWGFYKPRWINGIDKEPSMLWNAYPNMRPYAWMLSPPPPTATTTK